MEAAQSSEDARGVRVVQSRGYSELSADELQSDPGSVSDEELQGYISGYIDDEVPIDQVFDNERKLIEQKALDKAYDGTTCNFPKGEPFTLAFSGGGIRAAAFQAGVLWKLAETGRLKDVDVLSAVSGGGYIAAAYQSHLLAAEQPQPGENIDDWYREVVAQTIVRMQANTGSFVRDSGMDTSLKGGCCNTICRAWDCPLLCGATIFTMLVNPLAFFLLVVMPVTQVVEIFFGSGMRAAFCISDQSRVFETLRTWAPMWPLYILCFVSMGCTFLFMIFSCFCKPLPLEEGEKYHKVTGLYLFAHSVYAFLIRWTCIVVGLIIVIISTVFFVRKSYEWEDAIFSDNRGGKHCSVYTGDGHGNGTAANFSHCSSRFNSMDWYTLPEFHNVSFATDNILENTHIFTNFMKFFLTNNHSPDLSGALSFALFALLLLAILLLPFIPDLFSSVVALIGPAALFLIMLDFVKFRVYGPLTKARLFGTFEFDERMWQILCPIVTVLAIPFILFYQQLRGFMHAYYRKVLRYNYFADGEDNNMTELGRDCPYSPFFIMTGTASDFVRPGDTNPHYSTTEISFTPLTMGSEKTGYIKMPKFFSMAEATALTGAGGLDAVGLSLNDATKLRFWVEALNLTWGDYVLFESQVCVAVRRLSKTTVHGHGDERACTWFLMRMPAVVTWFIIFTCFATASYFNQFGHGNDSSCRTSQALYAAGGALWFFLFLASFFSFVPCCVAAAFSPLLRNMHQLTRYYYPGNKPPPMLYITDGGAVDCTTLMQLVKRRCRRILLVLAAMDPNDELGVLRTAMNEAMFNKLCSFYDPKDPARDIKVYLDEFKDDKSKQMMHIGIKYGWAPPEEGGGDGVLVIVKNRLRPENAPWPVQPLLTQDEVTGWQHDPSELVLEDPGDDTALFEEKGLTQDELGGFGCCDSCHLCCNAGPKWPQLNGANYLWLTPQLFNGLCRLAHYEAGPAIDAVVGPLPRS